MCMVDQFPLFEQDIEDFLPDDARTIMVIGGPDTGKTTLVGNLAKFFAGREKTAILDVDPGQSTIGLPTTVAWAQIEGEFEKWDSLRVQDFYFIGDTSPRGNLLPLAVGARLIWDKASCACERIIVDTTGLIRGGLGKVLKLHLIDILRPRVVLAICKQDELDHILTALRGVEVPRVLKVRVPSQVKNKHFSQRRSYRELKFKSYFEKAREVEFSLREVGLDKIFYSQKISSLLVSLRDKIGRDIALGIIKGWSKVEGTVTIYSPLPNPELVGQVVLGRLKLTSEGKQISTERFR